MHYTLTHRDEDGTLTVKEFDGILLDDVVSRIQDFLHGVGFVFEELEIHTHSYDEETNTGTPQFIQEDLNEKDLTTIASYYKHYRATD
jgi:hypothetical protein